MIAKTLLYKTGKSLVLLTNASTNAGPACRNALLLLVSVYQQMYGHRLTMKFIGTIHTPGSAGRSSSRFLPSLGFLLPSVCE